MSQGTERELQKRYHAALRKYFEANATLEGLIGPEFEEAFRRAEQSRAEFDQVRHEVLEFRAKAEGA